MPSASCDPFVPLQPTDLEETVARCRHPSGSATTARHVDLVADQIRFFEPGRSDSLPHALLEALHDPDGPAACVERARRRNEAYRWGVNAGKYLAILESPVVPKQSFGHACPSPAA